MDVAVRDHGSTVMINPKSERALAWVDEYVQLEGWQWLGTWFACEPRFIWDLIGGMEADGLSVEYV